MHLVSMPVTHSPVVGVWMCVCGGLCGSGRVCASPGRSGINSNHLYLFVVLFFATKEG